MPAKVGPAKKTMSQSFSIEEHRLHMDKAEEKIIISRLVFDLSVADGFTFDLDVLLERLCGVLQGYPELPVMQHGAILLLSPRGQFFQVAQCGFPEPWETEFRWGTGALMAPVIGDCSRIEDMRIPIRGEDGIRHETVRLILLPLRIEERGVGYAVLQVPLDYEPPPIHMEFMNDLALSLSGLVNRALTLETLHIREFELEEARTNAIRSLGVASEYRDNETGWHIMRMTNIAQSIAKAMGLSDAQRDLLYITAPMHDVGKIGIPDAILLKPGKLSPDEYETMKRHTDIGVTILTGNDALIAAAREIAGSHHEHWDGSGYPRSLKGDQIPVLARVCAVADVFDALTSTRPYKEPWSVEAAIEWIISKSGSHFDPDVVQAFEQAIPEILRIRELYRDDIIDPKKELSLPPIERRPDEWASWDASMSVGIGTIDEHHRYLFDLINDLFDVVRHKRGAREVARLLKALEAYTKVHFRAEEQMMIRYGFEGIHRQEAQHHAFEEKLGEFYEELHANPLITQFDVLSYLRGWLVHHIKEEDTQLCSLAMA